MGLLAKMTALRMSGPEADACGGALANRLRPDIASEDCTQEHWSLCALVY